MSHRVEPIDLHIAERSRIARDSAGLSLNAVAKHLGISYQSYSKMEGGKTSFRAGTLLKLSERFGVPVTYFYEGFHGA